MLSHMDLDDHGVYGTRPSHAHKRRLGKVTTSLWQIEIFCPHPRVETDEYRMQLLPPAGVLAQRARRKHQLFCVPPCVYVCGSVLRPFPKRAHTFTRMKRKNASTDEGPGERGGGETKASAGMMLTSEYYCNSVPIIVVILLYIK